MWRQGMTAADISRSFQGAVSRSAVQARLARGGIYRGHRPRGGRRGLPQRLTREMDARIAIARPVRVPTPGAADVPPLLVEFLELEPCHCRWPFGDEPPFRFCGRERLRDGPYCAAHHQEAHAP
jgi:hypothetical protein